MLCRSHKAHLFHTLQMAQDAPTDLHSLTAQELVCPVPKFTFQGIAYTSETFT